MPEGQEAWGDLVTAAWKPAGLYSRAAEPTPSLHAWNKPHTAPAGLPRSVITNTSSAAGQGRAEGHSKAILCPRPLPGAQRDGLPIALPLKAMLLCLRTPRLPLLSLHRSLDPICADWQGGRWTKDLGQGDRFFNYSASRPPAATHGHSPCQGAASWRFSNNSSPVSSVGVWEGTIYYECPLGILLASGARE